MEINIIYPIQTFGFYNDAKVYYDTIRLSHPEKKVNIYLDKDTPKNMKTPAINIFVDRIMFTKIWMTKGSVNCLMMNHELFLLPDHKTQFDRTLNALKQFRFILCKTEIGLQFAIEKCQQYNLPCKLIHIGHTTMYPHPRLNHERRTDTVLHNAGNHKWKNTEIVLKTWVKYGHRLPHLIVTAFGEALTNAYKYMTPTQIEQSKTSKYITMIDTEITYVDLLKLKFDNAIHLCPSMAEGFGHYINEGRATGSIVITTDLPPMNELIRPEFGFLITPCKIDLRTNGAPFGYLDEESIADTVTKAATITQDAYETMSRLAYKAYYKEKNKFEENLSLFIMDL